MAAALAHSLPTLDGIVLHGESPDLVAARVAAFVAQLAPEGHAVEAVLAQRLAMLSVRAERCLRYERAMTADRLRTAEADFDEARKARADFLMDHIGQAPATHSRELLSFLEGITAVLARLRSLKCATVAGDPLWGWSAQHGWTFEMICGRRLGDVPTSRCSALSHAIERNDYSKLSDPEAQALTGATRLQWAMTELGHLIDGEIARIAAIGQSIDPAPTLASRQQAVERALVGNDPASILARRFELATERSMHRTLHEIRLLTKQRERERADLVAAVALAAANAEHLPAEMGECDRSLGSFGHAFEHKPQAIATTATIDREPLANRPVRRHPDRKRRGSPL